MDENASDDDVADADVFASKEAGEQYRDTVYRDIDYESLETAPETAAYPKTDGKGRFKVADLPKVPKVSHIVGPSAIMLGASLGSGETMFWPTLVAQNGWGLYWAFWVGVITQFFINTELQRWTIATGESIFRAFERMHSFWPWFFLIAGFVHVGWPGWAAGAAKVMASGLGIAPSSWVPLGIGLMVLIWLSYQVGPVIYNIIEKVQLAMMIVAIFGALVLVFIVGSAGQLANIPAGAVNFGALPANMDIAVFLGGLAYAGAGGYINLSQGVWAREKGYGMASYQGRVLNPIRADEADAEEVHENGITFEPTPTNLRRWRAWWKIVQQEHFLTFVVGLLVVATVSMTISAEFAAGTEVGAIDMWLTNIIPAVSETSAALLYVVIFIALFSTQYAIMEAFVRNSVDIIFQMYGREAGWNLNVVFLGLLTLFVGWGILIIGMQLQQPWILLVLGAAIAGVMMWPYNALTTILNSTRLPEHTQPGWGRIVAMWWATGFFGYFSVLLIGDQLSGSFADAAASFAITAWLAPILQSFAVEVGVVGSGLGGYLLWLFVLAVQVYTMFRSTQGKLESSDTVDDASTASGLLS